MINYTLKQCVFVEVHSTILCNILHGSHTFNKVHFFAHM